MSASPILVTGAGRRVGLYLVRQLAARGDPVIAHCHRQTEELQSLTGQGVTIIEADLTDADAVKQLAGQVESRTASLRGIIHNASAFDKTDADPDAALLQFERFFAIHMRAPYLLNTLLAPRLSACPERHADIVHITDIYADNPNPAFDVYCATKAGLANLTLSFAKRLAPKVKVNAIAPGPILFKDWHSEAMRKQVLAETLLGEEGGEEAIWRAVEAILGNHYLTGAVIPVDGGRRLA